MKILKYRNTETIYSMCMKPVYERDIIMAASARELTEGMIRVESSNVWSYKMNVKHMGDDTGDVYVQFKNKRGGPGDVYVYYDVPIRVYQKWITTSSKGHYFWEYIRNKYKYSKLTGDKRGKLPNAIN